jgi:hypothetical protein
MDLEDFDSEIKTSVQWFKDYEVKDPRENLNLPKSIYFDLKDFKFRDPITVTFKTISANQRQITIGILHFLAKTLKTYQIGSSKIYMFGRTLYMKRNKKENKELLKVIIKIKIKKYRLLSHLGFVKYWHPSYHFNSVILTW